MLPLPEKREGHQSRINGFTKGRKRAVRLFSAARFGFSFLASCSARCGQDGKSKFIGATKGELWAVIKAIAIITGATGGIGKEFVSALYNEALDEIWIIGRNSERLAEIKEQ